MASTNKTANLHLNQWAASDPVLRSDFNADNTALDTAIAAIPAKKIREVTTTQAAQVLEFDLSDINLDDYTELDFKLMLKTAADGNSYWQTGVRFNSASAETQTKTRCMLLGNTVYAEANAHFPGGTQVNASAPPAIWEIRMNISPRSAAGYRFFSGVSQSSYMDGNSDLCVMYSAFSMQSNRLAKLYVIKTYPEYGGSKAIAAGSKLTIYGVKK